MDKEKLGMASAKALAVIASTVVGIPFAVLGLWFVYTFTDGLPWLLGLIPVVGGWLSLLFAIAMGIISFLIFFAGTYDKICPKNNDEASLINILSLPIIAVIVVSAVVFRPHLVTTYTEYWVPQRYYFVNGHRRDQPEIPYKEWDDAQQCRDDASKTILSALSAHDRDFDAYCKGKTSLVFGWK